MLTQAERHEREQRRLLALAAHALRGAEGRNPEADEQVTYALRAIDAHLNGGPMPKPQGMRRNHLVAG